MKAVISTKKFIQSTVFVFKLKINSLNTYVAAASLFIASRGGASPQKFEKRALTIFRLESDPYESAHQLDCSFLLPTAKAYGTGR